MGWWSGRDGTVTIHGTDQHGEPVVEEFDHHLPGVKERLLRFFRRRRIKTVTSITMEDS